VTNESGKEFRLTSDGSPNIINGIADWVYEEEIFAAHEALWFSTDASKLAFIKFNETGVKEYHLQYYMKQENDSYPLETNLKYPKVILLIFS
jgi:hypothetical protein